MDNPDGVLSAWPLKESAQYVQYLRDQVHPLNVLQGQGHVLQPLSGTDFDGKKRCERCGVRCLSRKGAKNAPNPAGDYTGSGVNLKCRFHPGHVINKSWSCCNSHVSAAPCRRETQHHVRQYSHEELETRWQHHETPHPGQGVHIRPVVAIDCEMGQAEDGESELIRLTLIDYFSSAPLIDKLVYPDVKLRHCNTKYSGVKRGDLEKARRQKTCIMGKHNARMELWKFVGPDTIVVGHSVQHDLLALRWIHPVVVDSYIIESALKGLRTTEDTSTGMTVPDAALATLGQVREGCSLAHEASLSSVLSFPYSMEAERACIS